MYNNPNLLHHYRTITNKHYRGKPWRRVAGGLFKLSVLAVVPVLIMVVW